jgi:hypothetical protein
MTPEELVRKKIRRIFGLLFLENGGTPRNMSYTSRKSAKYRNNKNYPFHKVIKTESENLEEISPEEITVPKQYIHDNLNPKIWDGDKLLPEVRKKLLIIAKEFYKSLEISAPIKGIKFIGSMANYNWSTKSDIDIHLFFDFKEINEDVDLVKNLLDARKVIWNERHNITVKGYSVELYSQDLNEKNASTGIFDLVKNDWEKKPTYEDFKVDKNAITTKVVSIINQLERLENNEQLSKSEVHKQGEELKLRIRNMRQCGLEKGGEFSVENLAFKYLRNNGQLERLSSLVRMAYDSSLSLNEIELKANHLNFTPLFIQRVAEKAEIDITPYLMSELVKGFKTELEHTDITHGDPIETLKIAVAHLKEVPNYYTRLEKYVEKIFKEQS